MGKASIIPTDFQLNELLNTFKKHIGTEIPPTEIPLTAGNLQKILSFEVDTYMQYSAKNGFCQIDFSFCVKSKSSTSNLSDSQGTETAIWIKLPVTLPIPIARARGQAMPVNSNVVSSANIRVDTDGSISILINNIASESYTWLQNSMTYIIDQ